MELAPQPEDPDPLPIISEHDQQQLEYYAEKQRLLLESYSKYIEDIQNYHCRLCDDACACQTDELERMQERLREHALQLRLAQLALTHLAKKPLY